MALQKFVTVTHKNVKNAAGKPAQAEVAIEALAHFEAKGWVADKAELRELDKADAAVEKDHAAEVKADETAAADSKQKTPART